MDQYPIPDFTYLKTFTPMKRSDYDKMSPYNDVFIKCNMRTVNYPHIKDGNLQNSIKMLLNIMHYQIVLVLTANLASFHAIGGQFY